MGLSPPANRLDRLGWARHQPGGWGAMAHHQYAHVTHRATVLRNGRVTVLHPTPKAASWLVDTGRQLRAFSRPVNRLSRTITWALALGSVGQGVGIIIGGAARWSGPGYTVVRQMPGSPWSWAIFILLFGLVTCYGSLSRQFWVKCVGMFAISAWCGAFFVGAVWTAYAVPVAGTTGIFAYLQLAVVSALMIFVDEGRPRRDYDA